jgi:4-diphosphocytidyl-2-C-methyl-D-erythritol kinase
MARQHCLATGFGNKMLTLYAPAKINWALFVLDRRDDGYHNIISLMQCIDLFDTLTFELSDGAIEVLSDFGVPQEENLVYKAALLIKQYAGEKAGARITLRKIIPVEAGLGGGSSDAACTISALNALWGIGLDDTTLQSIGGQIGSDVPFFFHRPMAFVQGRGEIVTGLEIERPYTLLLVKPPQSIQTHHAYRELALKRANLTGKVTAKLTKIEEKQNNIKLLYEALRQGDIASISAFCLNDIEEVVFERYPEVAQVQRNLMNKGAVIARMSGSGSTVFGLFKDRQRAIGAMNMFSRYWHRLVETLIV